MKSNPCLSDSGSWACIHEAMLGEGPRWEAYKFRIWVKDSGASPSDLSGWRAQLSPTHLPQAPLDRDPWSYWNRGFLFLFFFFEVTKDWTQGITLARKVLYHLNPQPFLALFVGPALGINPSIYASCITRNTGGNHWAQPLHLSLMVMSLIMTVGTYWRAPMVDSWFSPFQLPEGKLWLCPFYGWESDWGISLLT